MPPLPCLSPTTRLFASASKLLGLEMPIPTLPLESTRTLSLPLVEAIIVFVSPLIVAPVAKSISPVTIKSVVVKLVSPVI